MKDFPSLVSSKKIFPLTRWLMLLVLFATAARTAETLLGKPAPDWSVTHWINSAPRQLPEMKGKVVLVRWWMAPGCPYCFATAPALNEFYTQYREQGLEVLGFYHHKSAAPFDLNVVKQYTRRFGFEFPVAVDLDWRTLKQWWLNQGGAQWTSVSFLLDREGIVRFIHPGGKYVKGDADYRALKAKIEELLAAKGAP